MACVESVLILMRVGLVFAWPDLCCVCALSVLSVLPNSMRSGIVTKKETSDVVPGTVTVS